MAKLQAQFRRPTAFYRVPGGRAEDKVEAVLLRWQEKVLGPVTDSVIAIDGKELRVRKWIDCSGCCRAITDL